MQFLQLLQLSCSHFHFPSPLFFLEGGPVLLLLPCWPLPQGSTRVRNLARIHSCKDSPEQCYENPSRFSQKVLFSIQTTNWIKENHLKILVNYFAIWIRAALHEFLTLSTSSALKNVQLGLIFNMTIYQHSTELSWGLDTFLVLWTSLHDLLPQAQLLKFVIRCHTNETKVVHHCSWKASHPSRTPTA